MKANAKLIEISYKGDLSALEKDVESLGQKADEGYNSKLLHITLAVYLGNMFLSALFWLCAPEGRRETAFVIVLIMLPIIIVAYLLCKKERMTHEQEESELLRVEAFGGADEIVLIGMFAYYGLRDFIITAAASLIICSLWAVIDNMLRKSPLTRLSPIMPAFLCTVPLRLLLSGML